MPALDAPYTKFERRTRSPATDESTTSVPWPCARSLRATGMRDRHRAQEVGARHRGRRLCRGRRALRVAKHPEREQHEVDVAVPVEHVVHERLVRVGVVAVEPGSLDSGRAGGADLGRSTLGAGRVAYGQDDGARAARREGTHRGER